MTTRTLTIFLAIIPIAAIIACAVISLGSDPIPQMTPDPGTETPTIEAAPPASAAAASASGTVSEPSGSPSPSRIASGTVASGIASAGRPHVSPFPTLEPRAQTGGSPASEPPASAADSSRAVTSRPPASSAPAASGSAPAAASLAAANAPRKLPLPLAFQDLDPEAPGLSEAQASLLNSLRADFVRDIGGPQQNAHDPRYADRWRKLQPRYDAQLRLFFGAAFVEKLALKAAQADSTAGQP